jgi:hypothetical protein
VPTKLTEELYEITVIEKGYRNALFARPKPGGGCSACCCTFCVNC